MEIVRAEIEDAEEILSLQKLAYQSEAELYSDFDIPPLTQTLDEIKAQFADHVILKTMFEDKIIGTVRACEKNDTCHIGRLAVHPKMQNRGVGQALLQEIEKYFACKRFELFTGSKSDKNIHLYRKHGYHVIETSKIVCRAIEILRMEKCV